MIGGLRLRRHFLALRASRTRGSSGPVRITYVDIGDIDQPRVAFAISRKVGGAVVRNRIRRRLKGILSEILPQLLNGAYLVNVSPEAATLSYSELKTNVKTAVAAVTRQAHK